MKTFLALTVLLSASSVHAQMQSLTVTPELRSQVDLYARQVLGRSCSSNLSAKAYSDGYGTMPFTAAFSQYVTNLKYMAKDIDRNVVLTQNSTESTKSGYFIAEFKKRKEKQFTILFQQTGRMYVYQCTVR